MFSVKTGKYNNSRPFLATLKLIKIMKNRDPRLIMIRRGRSQDTEELFKVTIKSIEALCAKDYTSKQLKCLLEDKTQRFNKGIKLGETIFVAESEGLIIGYCSLLSRTISAMFVLPQYARQGVGKQLLAKIEAEAIARNRKILTAISSLTGVPFYQACGYRCLGNYSLSIGNDQIEDPVNIPCIRMEKSLLPAENSEQEGIFDVWMGMGKIVKWILEGGLVDSKTRK